MDRSKLRNAIYSILLLAFFFAVGLAGGVLYRVLPTNKTPSQPETKVAEESTSAGSTTTETSAATTAPAATPAPQAPVTPAAPAASREIAPATPETAPQTTAVAAAESQPAPKPAEKPAAEKAEAPAASASAAAPPAPEAKTPVPAPAPAPKPPTAHREAVKPARNAKTASIAPAAKPAPPEQAAAAATPAAKHAGADMPPFRIQFGAFAIEDNAHRTQWAVEATGMAVEVTRAPSRKGRMLYYVRSQPFPTRAAALAAAIAARDKAKKFKHPEKIEYVVLNDAMIAAEEGHKAAAQQQP